MEIFEVTALTEADLVGLRPKSVSQLRAFHHMVARLYAQGHKYTEIARVVGRSPPTIKNWLSTPANQELVEQYREEAIEDVQDQMGYRLELRRRASILAGERLVERLEAGEEIPDRVLLSIWSDSDDRTGLARTETRVNLNASIGAQLDKAAKRVKAMRQLVAPQSPVVELPKQANGEFGKVLGLERRI